MFITTLTYNLLNQSTKEFNEYGGVVEPWSLIPLLCMIIGLSLVGIFYVFGKFLKKKEKGTKYANLFIFLNGLIFLVLEIVHEIMQFAKFGYYDFSSFPFQFCTMPLYICLFLPFIKNEKKRMPFIYFLSTYCFISGLIPLFLGQSNLCRWDSVSLVIRSFEWHLQILGLSLFLNGFYNIGSNFKVERKFMLQAVGVFLVITVIAQVLNLGLHYYGGQYFEAPYSDELGVAIKSIENINYRDPDSASCFYFSPFFRSNIVFFDKLWLICGWEINYVVYLIAFTIGALLVLGSIFLIRYIFHIISIKITKKAKNA